MKRDAALRAYFAEAASWDADRVAASERSVRTAWRVAVGACVLAVAAIFALVLLMPLKRVDPFVIRVDNATGIVDQPRLPRFKAYTNYDNYVGIGTWTKIGLNDTDTNDQGAFDAANNHFVAPVDGTYLFGAMAPGGSTPGEYGIDVASLAGGTHYLQILREDHGGSTGYSIQMTADRAAVPEPAALALLGIGLAGLGWMRRRAG